MHTLILTIAGLIVLALVMVALCAAAERGRKGGLIQAVNSLTVGTHSDSITKFSSAAITSRHLLFKLHTDVNRVALAGASDVPLGTVDDEASAAGAEVTVNLLGKGSTKRMVASGVIGAGVVVYAAANGKVAASGMVAVGISLTAAGADNGIIEVADIAPVRAGVGLTHFIYAAGVHNWAGGSATTDSISVVGLEATDVVLCTLAARASTETLTLAVNDAANDQIDLTLSANGTNTTTKVAYQVLRPVA